MMKLKKVYSDQLLFDNGYILETYHRQDCCEHNYPDFSNIADEVGNYGFDETRLCLERVKDCGFRFGDNKRMFFVPCYSEQNGYYSSDITVRFFNKENKNADDHLQLEAECRVKIY